MDKANKRSLLLLAAVSALEVFGCRTVSGEAAEPAPQLQSATSATPPPARPELAPPQSPVVLHLTDEAAPEPVASPAPSASLSVTSDSASPSRPCRVAALGDSLTDYRSNGGGFLRFLEAHCPRSEFSNYGKGGDMVNQMRRRFEAEILAEPATRFTHLIVFGGVNDLYSDETAGRTPRKIENDLLAIYGAARQRGWRVVALTVPPWGGFKRWFSPARSATTAELNAWLRAGPSAGRVQAAVDAFALLSCGDSERLCPDFEPPFHDGLHFGKKGHEALGKALLEAEFKKCL